MTQDPGQVRTSARQSIRGSAAAAALSLSMVLVACDQPEADNGTIASSVATAAEPADFVVYTGPADRDAYRARYGTACGLTCVFELSPVEVPLTKADGEPLCRIAQYESRAVGTFYFARDDAFEGMRCEISQTDYAEIADHYGRSRIFKRYLDQRLYEDFATWKTREGFLTTYSEILGRAPGGGTRRSYHIYFGRAEHRHYSDYPID